MQDFIESLMKILERNYIVDNKNKINKDVDFYLNSIIDEVDEVKKELKLNNQVYLEDELSDILRNYFGELFILKKNGYIDSVDNVLKHCLEKFSNRVHSKESGVLWKDIKIKQKQELEKRHNLKYNN